MKRVLSSVLVCGLFLSNIAPAFAFVPVVVAGEYAVNAFMSYLVGSGVTIKTGDFGAGYDAARLMYDNLEIATKSAFDSAAADGVITPDELTDTQVAEMIGKFATDKVPGYYSSGDVPPWSVPASSVYNYSLSPGQTIILDYSVTLVGSLVTGQPGSVSANVLDLRKVKSGIDTYDSDTVVAQPIAINDVGGEQIISAYTNYGWSANSSKIWEIWTTYSGVVDGLKSVRFRVQLTNTSTTASSFKSVGAGGFDVFGWVDADLINIDYGVSPGVSFGGSSSVSKPTSNVNVAADYTQLLNKQAGQLKNIDTALGVSGSLLGNIATDITNQTSILEGSLTGVINAVKALPASIATTFGLSVPIDASINFDGLKLAGNLFTTKFPFSLPWDLYNSFSVLAYSGATAPNFHVDLSGYIPGMVFNIDLSMWSDIVAPVRLLELLCFDIGLIFITRKLLGGGV